MEKQLPTQAMELERRCEQSYRKGVTHGIQIACALSRKSKDMTDLLLLLSDAGSVSLEYRANIRESSGFLIDEIIRDVMDDTQRRSQVTKDDFTTKMQAQTLRNAIIDCENDITAMVEGMRVKRDELYALKRKLHELENPGKPYTDADLF
jgi:polyhydroxyalkanoate synthesis regulator phasin